jgi:hypothetical protein
MGGLKIETGSESSWLAGVGVGDCSIGDGEAKGSGSVKAENTLLAPIARSKTTIKPPITLTVIRRL